MKPAEMMTIPNATLLGEFASRLQTDASGELKRQYCEMFDAAQSEARRRLYEPLTTEEHESTLALAEGSRECAEVVTLVWNALHP
jgi:nitrate reductase assembly molybdenum cofactor insertion protein NarJ